MYLGQVAGLGDKYANYYTKEEYAEMTKTNKGVYTGIGIVFLTDQETGAVSIEDDGDGIMLNRFCFNVQPGIRISYSDGSSRRE